MKEPMNINHVKFYFWLQLGTGTPLNQLMTLLFGEGWESMEFGKIINQFNLKN